MTNAQGTRGIFMSDMAITKVMSGGTTIVIVVDDPLVDFRVFTPRISSPHPRKQCNNYNNSYAPLKRTSSFRDYNCRRT